jgi:phosphoribosylaminoimidazole-succinocarboxamide synthase
MPAISETVLKSFPMIARGKVRDIYDLNKHLLIVATDRLSAFDVVFSEPIPEKGKVLTGLAVYWFNQTQNDLPNHLISADVNDIPGLTAAERDMLRGRSMLVKKGEVVPVECVVRGYLAGSGWSDYKKTGTVSGIQLPAGLMESSKLSEPIFTPTTKESAGHDQPLTYGELVSKIGSDLALKLKEYSLQLYKIGAAQSESRGIILADTKFEFAWVDGELTVVDEIFTPDSSRFWPMDQYQVGKSQTSFDKQYVRDYLESIGWNKQPPAPPLPAEVIARTSEKYLEAYKRIVGKPLEL